MVISIKVKLFLTCQGINALRLLYNMHYWLPILCPLCRNLLYLQQILLMILLSMVTSCIKKLFPILTTKHQGTWVTGKFHVNYSMEMMTYLFIHTKNALFGSVGVNHTIVHDTVNIENAFPLAFSISNYFLCTFGASTIAVFRPNRSEDWVIFDSHHMILWVRWAKKRGVHIISYPW
jgi:hypothetical protein